MVKSLSLPTAYAGARSIAGAVLFVVLGALALGCNAFDDPPSDHDDDSSTLPPASGFGGRGSVPTFPGIGGSGSPLIPPPPTMGPSRGPMGDCIPCGAFCSDCGRGCECADGHSKFDPALWSVPFTGAGSDGWRQSDSALCPGMDTVVATHVWGDGRSVYALVAGTALTVENGLPVFDDDAGVARSDDQFGSLTPRTRVFRNGGTGWMLRADLNGASQQAALTGFADSLLVYGGPGEDRRACSLGMVTAEEFECELNETTIQAIAVVSPTLAYAIEGPQKLRVFDGTKWKLHPEAIPRTATAIWADEHELVAVGLDGNVLRLRDDEWTVENVGSISRLTAVWGTSGNDLWVGTFGGALLHFDGSGWKEIAQLGGVTCTNRMQIERIWGVGSHVWVHTAAQLVRWDGSELTTFGNWSCSSVGSVDRISNVWGTAENDVFIAVAGAEIQPPCGAAFVVHYDGELFHRF